jgi:hypothetical protein
MSMPLQALVLVQRQLASASVDAGQRGDAACTLMRLGLLCRTAAGHLVWSRAVQLQLLYDRQQLADIRVQQAALQRRHANMLADYERLVEDVEFDNERGHQVLLSCEELVVELGFDPRRPDHQAYVTFIREMRRRPATVQAAPRTLDVLQQQRAELLRELGAHADYDQHAAVVARAAELRLRLPLTPLPFPA